MRILLFSLILMLSSQIPSWAGLQTSEVQYSTDDVTMQGYLAYDDAFTGQRPGVLVVHEWWGHNDYARQRAEMLAGLGYVALAVDMYGQGKVADHPEDAGKFASAVRDNMPEAMDRFRAALNVLKDNDLTQEANIAAIGYCFGGSIVLNAARAGIDLDGVVSFHGSLASPLTAEPGAVKARVLVLHGADDTFITDEQIAAFKEEMEAAGVDFEFIAYPGAKHSFTNPQADQMAEQFGLGIAYDKEADQKSWQRMQEFFDEIFSNDNAKTKP